MLRGLSDGTPHIYWLKLHFRSRGRICLHQLSLGLFLVCFLIFRENEKRPLAWLVHFCLHICCWNKLIFTRALLLQLNGVLDCSKWVDVRQNQHLTRVCSEGWTSIELIDRRLRLLLVQVRHLNQMMNLFAISLKLSQLLHLVFHLVTPCIKADFTSIYGKISLR